LRRWRHAAELARCSGRDSGPQGQARRSLLPPLTVKLRCGACGCGLGLTPIGLPGTCRFTATGYPPGRSAPRTLLCRLDLPLLLEAFNSWLTAAAFGRAPFGAAERISRRGSKRDCEAPAFGHRVGLVLGQVVAEGQDKTEAAADAIRRQGLLT